MLNRFFPQERYSNPLNPFDVGFFDTGGITWNVAVGGNYAYVADTWEGMRIIDISNPSNPFEVGFFDTGSSAMGVTVSGNYAYVADGDDGLYILQNDLISSVDDNILKIPKNYNLSQNYPNPFNVSTTISFNLLKASFVSV